MYKRQAKGRALPASPKAHSGIVSHEAKIGDVSIEIREDANWRWLIFVNDHVEKTRGLMPIQSLFYKLEPSRLIPAYMQVMCAGVALSSSKTTLNKQILQLGLGGGAINRFLLDKLAVQHLTTVERHPELIDAYHHYFADGTSQLREVVIEASAERFLDEQKTHAYELILVDLFEHDGLPSYCYHPSFYRALQQSLQHNGVVAINIPFRADENLTKLFISLRTYFQHVSFVDIPDHENIVVFASAQSIEIDKNELAEIDKHLDIDVLQYLENMIVAPIAEL